VSGWIALLCATTVSAASAGAALQDAGVAELAARIQRERDRVEPAVFERLAAIGDEASLRALERGIGVLKGDDALVAAHGALRLYAGREDVASQAIELLTRQAARARSLAARRECVRALSAFGERALDELERILTRNQDAACRAIACDALVPWLARRGDAESVTLILEQASLSADAEGAFPGVAPRWIERLRGKTQREVVAECLGWCEGPEALAAMGARLARRESPRGWKLLLIDVLARRTGADASAAIGGALGDTDAGVVLHALDALVPRGDWSGLEDAVRPLLRSREAGLRRAAVEALGRIKVTHREWHDELAQLAGARDAATRMGAACALAELRTLEALALLHGLLSDPEWSVRAEALERVAALRGKESIPLLIGRLKVERGRLGRDVHGALRLVTAMDLGREPERWERWWANEGAGFVVPPLDVARTAEGSRAEREAEERRTVASTFYGADVVSERVCFVLDVSGSMLLPSGSQGDAGEPAPEGTRTRMDVAKEELSDTIRHLPDGTLFNAIFFESEVKPWRKGLVEMKKQARQEVLRFVRDQFALGATALYPALELAFADPLVDTLYVLTDGAPTVGAITDIAEIRAEVRAWNAARKVRIHGITMGQDSTLLHWLTEDTGGRYLRID